MDSDEKKRIIDSHLSAEVFHLVGHTADKMGRECYVVGGYVRDMFLGRHSKDIDFVTVGSGIEVAQAVAKTSGKGSHIAVYRNFGTAQVRWHGLELEFVGARRESYDRRSRKPRVEDGTLADDQRRRDFTVNAMAVCLNAERYGQLLDPFDGMGDMARKIIRTPLDPDITFSDDPLRMMRAIRFATQLDFDIFPDTFRAIERNRKRIEIISGERVADELMKIMASRHPSRGFILLAACRLLDIIMPELAAMRGVETVNGHGHKDNFSHTMQVLENVAAKSDNVWLRWAALMHDIAKPVTKRFDPEAGWTFHNHNFVGGKMVPKIFKRLKLPMDDRMRYVQKLVELHMRPIALVEDEVTDSAVRRLLFDAGDDIDDLMALCEADITSKNQSRVRRFLDNFALVRRKLVELEERDRLRNFQPPVSGEVIMNTFGLQPCRQVGTIKETIKNAILDGVIPNEYPDAYQFMINTASGMGLRPVSAKSMEEIEREEFTTVYESPIGLMEIVASHRGVKRCAFIDSPPENLSCNAVTDTAVRELGEYFAGKLRNFTVKTHTSGTEFQRKAWDVLRQIPYGSTITYKEQAARMGCPNAARAAGAANSRNPVAVIVPCHRVIAASGLTAGYAYGPERKRWLISHEAKSLERDSSRARKSAE